MAKAAAGRPPAGTDTLVFSHANGFPAGTYRVLFQAWEAAGWRVLALPRFGHDPAFPVTSNWPQVRDELLAFIDHEAPGQQVHLVGHSLGGYLSLLAASRRPQGVASVVLIDSPVLSGWRAHSVRVAKAMGLIKRVSPGHISQRRRWQWSSAEAAYTHFASKRAFARWQPEVLRDYITCGTEPDPDTPPTPDAPQPVRLVFRRDVETRLYNTLPHNMGQRFARHPVQAPVAFVGGTQSLENRQVGMAATRAMTHGRMMWLQGPHLFPMERPFETAQAVLSLISDMMGGRSRAPAAPQDLIAHEPV
jgi:pimeloyl-ACP methyl ester carboxylesterase